MRDNGPTYGLGFILQGSYLLHKEMLPAGSSKHRRLDPPQPTDRHPLLLRLHLVVHARQRLSLVLLSQPLIPPAIVDLPELFFRIVRIRIQPLKPAQPLDLGLQRPVQFDERLRLARTRTPHANIEHEQRAIFRRG